MLTEEFKQEIVNQYKKAVYRIARRVSFFDTDIDEIRAWGYLGIAKALSDYEKNLLKDPSFELSSTMIIMGIEHEIHYAYRKRRQERKVTSMDAKLLENEENEATLGDFLADESSLYFNELEIRDLLRAALKSELTANRDLVIESLLDDVDSETLMKKYNLNNRQLTKIKRQGVTLVKKYLLDNDIVDSVETAKEYGYKGKPLRPLKLCELRKIKYLINHFGFLSTNDIAELVNVNSYKIQELFYYPPNRFKFAEGDSSIHQNAIKLIEQKYPERFTGKF